MSERTIQEIKLSEYGLFLGTSYLNPRTNNEVKRTAFNRRNIYNMVVQDETRINQSRRPPMPPRRRVRPPRPQRPPRPARPQRRRVVIVQPDIDNFYVENIAQALRQFMGKTVRIVWNGQPAIDVVISIPDAKFSAFMTANVMPIFQFNSQFNVFQAYMVETGNIPPTVSIYEVGEVESKRQEQKFADGINHCLLTPIKNWSIMKKTEAKSKNSQYKYQTIINNITKYETEFKAGIPEDKLGEVCNKLQIGIDITLPLTDDVFIEIRSMRKPLKIFRYINTRLNHVLNGVVGCDNVVSLDTYKDLMDVKDNLDEGDEFYHYTKNKQIASITTLNVKYVLENEYMTYANTFEQMTELNTCKIDDVKDKDLSEFVAGGTHYNETLDFCDYKEVVKKNLNINQIDMSKAYFNYKKSPVYNGFLGKITDFRKTNTMLKIGNKYLNGIYKITNIKFNESKEHMILKRTNTYQNMNTYPTPDLQFLLNNNVSFDVLEGCWGVDNMDFEMPEQFLEKDEHGVAHYCRWVGACDSHRLTRGIWMKGDKELFENLKSYRNNDTIRHDPIENEGCITFNKKSNYHLGHVTAFITAYQRVSTLDQLLKFDIKNIIRICCDGIYYTGSTPVLKNVFRVKNDLNFNNKAGKTYISGLVEQNDMKMTDEEFKQYQLNGIDQGYGVRRHTVKMGKERKHFNIELHVGAGGTGKTHYNLKDDGLVRPLYIAPSWKLARKKQKDYNVNVSVLARLCSTDPERTRIFKNVYNVLIFDEVSMYTKAQIENIRENYIHHKIIFCGDIGYQLPCITGDKIDETDFKNVIKYNKNWRVDDSEYLHFLNNIRDMMDKKTHVLLLMKYIKNELKNRTIDRSIMDYQINDFIICNTNKQKDEYTLRYTGMFDKEKYNITSNNYTGYSNGEIIIASDELKHVKTKEIRHGFTIHSIQGETAENKLFIDTRRITSSQMIYTALSRARRFDQVYLLK